MSSVRTWMVRAGRGGRVFEDFRNDSLVAIGWNEIGDLNQYGSRKAVIEAVARAYPAWKAGQVAAASGQIYRFAREMKVGDGMVTYDPSGRVYLLGH